KMQQTPVVKSSLMLLARTNRVSIGLEALQFPHAVPSPAQAGALTPTTSPSTTRLLRTTTRPTFDSLRIAFLLISPARLPRRGGCSSMRPYTIGTPLRRWALLLPLRGGEGWDGGVD